MVLCRATVPAWRGSRERGRGNDVVDTYDLQLATTLSTRTNNELADNWC